VLVSSANTIPSLISIGVVERRMREMTGWSYLREAETVAPQVRRGLVLLPHSPRLPSPKATSRRSRERGVPTFNRLDRVVQPLSAVA